MLERRLTSWLPLCREWAANLLPVMKRDRNIEAAFFRLDVLAEDIQCDIHEILCWAVAFCWSVSVLQTCKAVICLWVQRCHLRFIPIYVRKCLPCTPWSVTNYFSPLFFSLWTPITPRRSNKSHSHEYRQCVNVLLCYDDSDHKSPDLSLSKSSLKMSSPKCLEHINVRNILFFM